MASPIGSEENPCTSRNSTSEQRAMKYCFCEHCGKVKQCTPAHDFYIRHSGDTLACQLCFLIGVPPNHKINAT